MTGDLPAVCFFQAYNRDYVRSEALASGLAANGVELLRATANFRGPLRYPLALARFLGRVRRCDVVLANFRSFEILPLLRRLTRKPIVYDAHISMWQSACEERRWFSPDSPPGRLLRRWDRDNCALADHVLLDTAAHREFFVRELGVAAEKITVVYVSCDPEIFRSSPLPELAAPFAPSMKLRALWVGTGVPVQGLEVVLAAFRRLGERQVPVTLRVVGSGAAIDRLARQARADGMTNVEWNAALPARQTAAEIAASDIGLGGHYSLLTKAANTIPGKVAPLIASGRPVVLGDSPAVRELFTDGEDALLCERGSPAALAAAIERLAGDHALRLKLATNGHALFNRRLLPRVSVEPLLPVLRRLAAATHR